jgi:hypothetical protein
MDHLRVTVSGTRNRTHVLYVASWLRHVLADGRVRSVSVVELNSGGRIRDELERPDGILRDIGPIELVDRHVHEGEHAFVSIGSPGIKTWARFRLSPGAWPLRTIVVDEGIGSYGDVSTKRAAMRREGSSEPWLTVRAWAGVVGRRLLPDESWRLYRRAAQGWELDERVAAEFRRSTVPAEPSNTVVFITQPWVENRLVTAARYVAHLREIAGQVESVGADFAVRPHPTEDHGRYAPFRVLDSALPAELDPDLLAARYVLGETSTALLNIAAVHRIPAARVVGPLAGISSIALSPAQDALFRHFVPTSLTSDQVAAVVGGRILDR